VDDDADGGDHPRPTSWSLAEIVAVALQAILIILLAVSVIASFATPDLFGSVGAGSDVVVGSALQRAGAWAAPQSAALFVLGSLALAWWQIESWTNDDGDPFDEQAFVHLRRAAVVTRVDLVLSLLTIVGGVLIAVGTSVQVSPAQDWSMFSVNLGVALGSLVLGVVGVVAARRLLASGVAAVATWHAAPAPA
jgi:hypothetical protein